VAGFQGKNIVLVEDEDGFQVPMLMTEVVVVGDEDYGTEHMVEVKTQSAQSAQSADHAPAPAFFSRSELLYMVGNVSTQFLDSEYARRCLHIVADPVKMTTVEEDIEYLQLILGSLLDAEVITSLRPVGQGGLFATLVAGSGGRVGFDILTCREIRLDAFLFGEEDGRFIVSLPERNDDFFLLKMDEARINCCFLGHVTKGRVLVDDMDYGDIKSWVGKS
jgi:phosphoribosylformylglycinamidine (FGAM) synthase-like enzyme